MPTNSLRSILSTSFIAHLFCLFGCVSLFAAALFSLPIFFARLVSVSVRPAVGQNQISDLQPMRRYCYCSISFLSLSHVLLTNAPEVLSLSQLLPALLFWLMQVVLTLLMLQLFLQIAGCFGLLGRWML